MDGLLVLDKILQYTRYRFGKSVTVAQLVSVFV